MAEGLDGSPALAVAVGGGRARRRVAWAVASVVLVALVAGCGGRGASATTEHVGSTGTLTQVPPASRVTAPVATGSALGTDRTLSTGDSAGKVVVVNVWGAWCPPCREEAADLQQASVDTAAIARFVGITTGEHSPAAPLAFIRAQHITYPSIYDPDGKAVLVFHGNLPLTTPPSTLVIDGQGRIAARITGPVSRTSLVQLITDVANGH